MQHQEAVDTLGLDRAAEPIARFEHPELQRAAALARQLRGPMRGGETRDATADDDELHAAARALRRTRSARAAMKSAWSLTADARCSVRPPADAVARASTSRSYSTST